MKILHLGLCVAPPPINGMQKAFIENCTEYRELNCGAAGFNEKAKQISDEFKPDLVFLQIQADNIITYQTVQHLKQNGAYVMNWTGDVRDDVPKWMIDLNPNITLFSNMRDVRKCNQMGIKSTFLEIGYDPEIYCPEGSYSSVPDIVFFGNNYGGQFPLSKYRKQMVEFLKSKFGHNFGVYGNGWEKADGNFNHSQREEAAAYRSAKIAINCSHYDIERYSSDRIFRILGTGVPLCMARYYDGIEKDFEHGKHLIYWNEFSDLEAKINHYLKSENERQFIVSNGNTLVKENFTFDCMIKNIIKIYNENKN